MTSYPLTRHYTEQYRGKIFGDSIFPSTLALGDIHGWAPALINLLSRETGFVVEMLGHELDESMVEEDSNPSIQSEAAGTYQELA